MAAREEALLLAERAGGDAATLVRLVERRSAGEPLAWLLGWAPFMGLRLRVEPGVYVPRPHSELLCRRALALLPASGLAVDLCTGSGALAAALGRACPDARVLASDVDPRACACARRNGVEALVGDLDAPLAAGIAGRADVVVSVPPYVPAGELPFLDRDARERQPRAALDGGEDGLEVVRRVAAAASRLLRPGGRLLVELGGDQGPAALALLARHGFERGELIVDEEGDVRGAQATLYAPSTATP